MRDLYAYSLSPDQFVGAVKRNSARVAERTHTRWFAGIAGGACFVALAAMAAQVVSGGDFLASIGLAPGTLVAIFVVCAFLAFFARHHGVLLLLRKSTFAPGAWQLGVDDDGLWTQGPHGESFTRWSGFRAVEEHGGLVLLYHDDVHVHPIPQRAFHSAEERRAFIEHVRAKIAAHPDVRAPAARPLAADYGAAFPADVSTPAPRLGPLVATAVRIATFQRVTPAQLAVAWTQVVGIAIATLLPPIAFALVSLGEAGHLAWMYLPQVLFHVPVMLVAAVLVAHLTGRTAAVAPLLAGTLLAWAFIDFISLGFWLAMREVLWEDRTAGMVFHFTPLAWLALAVTRLAISLAAATSRLVWVLAVTVLFLALPLGFVHRERSLWSMDYSRQADASKERRGAMMAAASEEALYRQPDLLREELAAVKPGRKGVVDVFLVGMAGYGQQDVFMREVDSVATLFRERFDADGHIVRLVNNPKTALRQPLASATSLEAALARVGAVMDADEDVLVLFLTSHGSSDHHFTVQLWPLELKQITPHMLREMLDASGIRNRVVIVSACYAGGFVRQLENENTLVIAAAAPDRNSFGCTNEADWTYFGKAYFDEALRQTTSFTRAFDIAKPLIEAREKKDKYEPSNPQISLGAGIKVKLEELERQMAAAPVAPLAERK